MKLPSSCQGSQVNHITMCSVSQENYDRRLRYEPGRILLREPLLVTLIVVTLVVDYARLTSQTGNKSELNARSYYICETQGSRYAKMKKNVFFILFIIVLLQPTEPCFNTRTKQHKQNSYYKKYQNDLIFRLHFLSDLIYVRACNFLQKGF